LARLPVESLGIPSTRERRTSSPSDGVHRVAGKDEKMSAMKTTDTGRKERRSVFVLSSHPILRHGFAHIIASSSQFTLAGEASLLQTAVARCARVTVDVLLMDLSPPTDITVTAIQTFISGVARTPVLVISTQDEVIYAERMMRAGARGYVMEQAGPAAVLKGLLAVANGHYFVGKGAVQAWAKSCSFNRPQNATSTLNALSNREMEIFGLLGQGKSVRSISTLLHISRRTVDVHRNNIRQKLRISSAADLLCFAVRWAEAQNNGANGSEHRAPLPDAPPMQSLGVAPI
jgi:DNA-binding NarL/FixJ family response regulator